MKKSRIPLMYGLFIAVALIAYFLLLAAFGLHKNPVYSILNIFITAGGIFMAVKKFRSSSEGKFKYQKGFFAALSTGFISTVIFTIFFAIYASEINPNFPQELITMWETGYLVNIGILIFTVALMGFASSFVIAFVIMQLYKPSWNTRDAQKHTY